MNYENIPNELKRLDQWVCARSDSKVPMQALEDIAASSTNPYTWTTFDTAKQAVSKGYYDYCGFVFADNGLVGIDVDDGYDQDGLLSTTAAIIIGKCKSYTEKSRSGRGFHIIVKGDIPFKGKNNLVGVEIYKTARYFIMTGDTLIFRTIEENQHAIDCIVEKYFPETKRTSERSFNPRIYSPVWQPPEDNRVKLRPTYPSIPNGSRNMCLTSLAGSLHTAGYSTKHIYKELTFVNETACTPPLWDSEIQTIVRSVTRYKQSETR